MLSLKEKIKMSIGTILGLAVFVIWENVWIPMEWVSACGVVSMFVIFYCLYLVLGTYGSRNLKGDYDNDRERNSK